MELFLGLDLVAVDFTVGLSECSLVSSLCSTASSSSSICLLASSIGLVFGSVIELAVGNNTCAPFNSGGTSVFTDCVDGMIIQASMAAAITTANGRYCLLRGLLATFCMVSTSVRMLSSTLEGALSEPNPSIRFR